MNQPPSIEPGTPPRATGGGWVDILLAAAGVGFALVSLSYPFGRDQGLYYYVAHGWLEGSIPYRDMFEQKTPGIFMIYALAILLFGRNMWGIHVLDIAGVVLVGLVAATFTVDRGQRPLPGVRGAAVLFASVLHFGIMSWWEVGQCEIWCALLAFSAIWAVRRMKNRPLSEFWGGLFAGATLVMKPPGVTFVLLAGVLVAWRAARETPGGVRKAIPAICRFALASTAAPAAVVLYFAAVGALDEMVDVLVRANAHYVVHESSVTSPWHILDHARDFYQSFNPVSSLLALGVLGALGYGAARREAGLVRRYSLVVALLLASLAAVVMQMKFYAYHWTVVLSALTVAGANLAADAAALALRIRFGAGAARFAGPRAAAAGAAAFAALTAGLFALTGKMWDYRCEGARNAIAHYIRHSLSREEFSRSFEDAGIGFDYSQSEAVGLWLKAHSSPGDTICVRGFQPEVYAVADRYYTGRMFWTSFLTDPRRSYRRAELNLQDCRDLAARPPRYVVVLTCVAAGPDSEGWFAPLGYQRVVVMGMFTVLERPKAAEGP
jgi:hypothetical protein